MTQKELLNIVDSLKREGVSEEKILNGFLQMYKSKKITFIELNGIVNLLGYHLSDDFIKNNK